MMEENELWFWLLSLERLGPVSHRRLFEYYGDIREIWRAKNPPLTEKQKDEFLDSRQEDRIRRSFHDMRHAGIRMVTAAEPDYPRRLRAIYDAPYGLFVKGELPNPNAPAVAIIGARRCTHHGGIIAEHTAAELTRAGILIISGLAIGIDSCSHQGALSAGGKTYAVMGCGPDICYPSSHRNLYEQIASHGGILSEYPPGREVRPAYFPLRNRIISGLADLVLVVEARERSGSLITVDQALEQGREVMAVPGRPDDPLSVGCNRLIREGAAICTESSDVCRLLGLDQNSPGKTSAVPVSSSGSACERTEEELRILKILTAEPLHTEQISLGSGIPVPALLPILLRLELSGCVRQVTSGRFQKTTN